MTEHEAFIRQCIALSEQAVRHGNEPFGALLVVDGDVRLTAQNQVLIESDPTRHAELLLASEAARRLDAAALERCLPVYEDHSGWDSPTAGVTILEDLPREARSYVERIEELVDRPIDIISTGPYRHETITVRKVI